jgi:ATP-binding cassette subfamily C exporter for protease/lipase
MSHLLLLIPTLVTLQIYDRVLGSRRAETLLMLLAAAALSLAAWWMVETARVR